GADGAEGRGVLGEVAQHDVALRSGGGPPREADGALGAEGAQARDRAGEVGRGRVRPRAFGDGPGERVGPGAHGALAHGLDAVLRAGGRVEEAHLRRAGVHRADEAGFARVVAEHAVELDGGEVLGGRGPVEVDLALGEDGRDAGGRAVLREAERLAARVAQQVDGGGGRPVVRAGRDGGGVARGALRVRLQVAVDAQGDLDLAARGGEDAGDRGDARDGRVVDEHLRLGGDGLGVDGLLAARAVGRGGRAGAQVDVGVQRALAVGVARVAVDVGGVGLPGELEVVAGGDRRAAQGEGVQAELDAVDALGGRLQRGAAVAQVAHELHVAVKGRGRVRAGVGVLDGDLRADAHGGRKGGGEGGDAVADALVVDAQALVLAVGARGAGPA